MADSSLKLLLEFRKRKTLVATIGGLTLAITRATEKRVFGADGLLQTVASGAAGFDHDPVTKLSLGILEEVARTNIWLHNRDWTNAVYTATNITPLQNAVGLDGVANSASTLTADANNGTITQTITVSSAAFTTSVWMKRKTGTGTVDITDNNFTNATDITSDINSSNFTKVGDITRTQANPIVGIRLGTSGDEVEVDFGQNEAGSFSTSPIPTGASSVTRNLDKVNSTDMSWLSQQAAGTLFSNATPIPASGFTGATVSIQDSGLSNGVLIRHEGNNTDAFARYRAAGSLVADLSVGASWTEDVPELSAVTWTLNDVEFFSHGLRSGTGDQSAAVWDANLDEIAIGQRVGGALQFNGHIAEIRYYNVRKDNQFLEDLSNGFINESTDGIPTGFFSIANCIKDPDFITLMRFEAENAGVWTSWVFGVDLADPVPKGTANLNLNIALIQNEAEGNANWARWAPGVQRENTGNLQLDMIAAANANFVLS